MLTINDLKLYAWSNCRQTLVNKRRAKPSALCLLGVLLLLFAAPISFAQTTGSATLRVNVKDPKNAVIPNATVTLISDRTSEQRTARTGNEGSAGFGALDPGSYTLKVENAGFKTYEQRGLVLNPSDTRGVDVVLEIGAASETVTVTGEASQIQTETGAKENTITSQQIDNLSIVSRSSLELLRILPGVVAPNSDDPGQQSVGFNAGSNANTNYHVNGLRGEENNVSIDGSRVIDIGSNNGTIITANPDMVQEVKVQTSNYAAEYGSSGVQITATTKGGGRDFHGEIYDYIRNHRFNANDRSRNSAVPPVPKPLDKYQYPGGNIGGPLCLPHLGEGGRVGKCYKEKLFFFFGFEVQRQQVDPGLTEDLVPTVDQRNGIGFVNQGDPSKTFNVDPSKIDPVGRALLNLYPLPNFNDPNGKKNYVFNALQPINRTQATLRVDYKINSKTSMYVRLAREHEDQDYARGLWWNPSSYEMPSHIQGTNLGRSVAINLTNVLSPSMTNEVVFSASKLMLDNDYKDPSKVSLSALGIPNYKGPFGRQSPYAPVSLITSWGGLTQGDFWEPGGLPLFAHNSSISVTDNLTKIKGAHALKFGALIEQGNKQQNFNGDPEGRYIFATWGNHSTGNEFADILTGNPAQFIQSTATPTGNFRFYNYEFYGQDSWKIRPNFTLEYGARIEFLPNNKELNNLAILFDPKAYDHTQGLLINNDATRPNGILQAAKGQIPAGITRNPGVRIAPRLNFAWDINGKGKTVIRGGAGLFYNRVQGNYQYYSLQQPPNSYSATFDGYGFNLSYGALGNINPFAQLGSVSLATANPDSIQIPRIATMSFSVARRLPFKNVLEVSYVGTLGRHLPDNRNINFIPPGRLLSGKVGDADLSIPVQRAALNGQANVLAQFRPFPAYSDIIVKEYNATSAYHSLQMTLSRQLGRRLTYFATYTFSKALGITGTNENGDNIDPIDARHRSYGVLPYDRTHIFNLSYNLNLPNGARGGLNNWLTRGLLNGWQTSGITTFQSGIPIRLRFTGDIQPRGATTLGFFGTDAFSNSQGSAGGIAPVFLSNPQLNGKNVGESVLSISSIAIPAFGTTGPTLPPFYLRSPHRSNFDMTFFKNFNFTENKKIQFRAGFFNIFNQAFPQYVAIDDPNNDFSTKLVTACNVKLDKVPNGTASGTSDGVCDPAQGYKFTGDTIRDFGRITRKHGHRVVEFALKFYF